ncbi:hypothetical protein ABZ782_09370 [Streptomyces asoensis]|uniref:hypothetical protein n=1 Tax=Streptomyces asoensis TaxID=249586 RepID=UPI003402481D
METTTCGCGEDRIPATLARLTAELVAAGLVVMFLTACLLACAMRAALWWRDRRAEDGEGSFFEGFGRWEEEHDGPPPGRGGGP